MKSSHLLVLSKFTEIKYKSKVYLKVYHPFVELHIENENSKFYIIFTENEKSFKKGLKYVDSNFNIIKLDRAATIGVDPCRDGYYEISSPNIHYTINRDMYKNVVKLLKKYYSEKFGYFINTKIIFNS